MKTRIIAGAALLAVLLMGLMSFNKSGKGDEYLNPCIADSSLGKPVFIRAIPMNEYEEVDVVKDKLIKKSGTAKFGMDKVIDLANKATATAGNYDAVVIDKASKAVLVKYKTKSNGAAIGKAQKVDGIDIYIYSKPIQAFTMGETIEINNFGIGQMDNTGDDLERIVNGLVQKARKKVKKGEMQPIDGLYIGSGSMNKALGVSVASSATVIRYEK